MSVPQTDATTDPQSTIAALQQRLDAALVREAALAEELAARDAALAQRNSEYGERIEHQAATIDVLKVMSASPGDAQPVFDLIVRRATELCNVPSATLFEYDGELVHIRSDYRSETILAPSALAAYVQLFPMHPTRGSISCRAILDRQIIHVRDLRLDRELAGYARELGHRSQVSVPLIRDELAIGVITIGAQAPGGFSDNQIELLKTFAEQAVIAISGAETYRNLHEALEQQTATAEVLQVINAKPGDLAPVFDAMLAKATRLCEAPFGIMQTYDGERFQPAASFRVPAPLAEFLAHDPSQPGPKTGLGRIARGADFVHIIDLANPGEVGADDPRRQRLVELGGVRTYVAVALRKDGKLLGSIAAYRQEIRPFTDKQIALLENFAAQAVIAMENARLLTEQREALEQQTATAEVLQVINTSPGDLVPVFDAILEKALNLCGAAFGILLTYDGERFHHAAFRSIPPAYVEFMRDHPPIYAPESMPGRLALGERLVHVLDITDTDAYRSGDANRRAIADLAGARTIATVSLRKDSALVGAIAVFRQEVRPFSDKQMALLENFAAQGVIAMENARLINEQREALEQQTATSEVLQVINASPGNLAPVFDVILEKAHQLCGSVIGNLVLFDGTQFRRVAYRGMSGNVSMMLTDKLRQTDERRRLLQGERFIHVPDLDAPDAPRSEVLHALRDREGVRSYLLVPMRKDGVLLGYISANWTKPRPDIGKEVALLENFAAQAVIAMENARLLTEQREALEQQTATAEILQVINASPGNLAPVFDAILETAHILCGAPIGSLVLRDGGQLRAVATRGYPHEYETLARQGFSPTGPFGLLLSGEPFVHVPDAATQPPVPPGSDPMLRAAVEIAGIRTVLFIPLRKDTTVLGYISAQRQEVRLFTDKQIALLQNFAAQAVIAMENARLLTEQQEALEQQTATAEVLQVINASPGDLKPVFDAILEKAMRLCEAAFGLLFTYEGKAYHLAAQRGVPAAYINFRTTNPKALGNIAPEGLRLLSTMRPYQDLDLMAGDDYRAADPNSRAFVELAGARTHLAVPLIKDSAVVGAIAIFRQEVRPFSDKQITLVESFAAQAAIAIENARLLNELRARTDELAQRQAELRVTFENMGDGVAMFDETQHLVAWNRKFQNILDVPDEALAARQTFDEYIRYLTERGEFGQGAEQEKQVCRIQATRGHATVFERTRPNGRVIEVRQNPVFGGGFVLIYADITERKRNEAQIRAARDAAEEASRTIEAAYRELKTAQANLIQAEKMASLGQLTAGIAHEIKNPLNFVNNFAALSVDLLSELKETVSPGLALLSEKQRAEVEDVSAMLTSNLEKITEHGKRADGIVKAMLEHSRGSSAERRTVDLNALIDEALNLAYHGARAQDQSFKITVDRDFGEGIAPIEVNPQDMTRVFLNLFANGFYAVTSRARDRGDAGFVPTLKVTTRDTGEAVEIRVRDNGTGIPADVRDKVFQPFFTTKPTGEGTGLGLSITYDIVTQQHGGTIVADSNVGEYSEFTIRLPRNP